MRHLTPICAALLSAAILSACSDDNALATAPVNRTAEAATAGATTELKTLKEKGDARIVSATGDILPAVNEFRALLGTLNPNLAGEQPGGRREVNW